MASGKEHTSHGSFSNPPRAHESLSPPPRTDHLPQAVPAKKTSPLLHSAKFHPAGPALPRAQTRGRDRRDRAGRLAGLAQRFIRRPRSLPRARTPHFFEHPELQRRRTEGVEGPNPGDRRGRGHSPATAPCRSAHGSVSLDSNWVAAIYQFLVGTNPMRRAPGWVAYSPGKK